MTEYILLLLVGMIVMAIASGFQAVGLRVRQLRARPPDPQLGRKFVLYLLVHFGLTQALIGATVSAYNVFVYALTAADEAARAGSGPPPPFDWLNETQRTAAAFVAAGLGHAAVAYAAAQFLTNTRRFPAVGRAFAGQRAAIGGLLLSVASTGFLIGLFQADPDANPRSTALTASIGVVWGPATIVNLALLFWPCRRADEVYRLAV